MNIKKYAVCGHVSSGLRHWIPPSATDNVAHAHTQTSSEQPEHLTRWEDEAPAGTFRVSIILQDFIRGLDVNSQSADVVMSIIQFSCARTANEHGVTTKKYHY